MDTQKKIKRPGGGGPGRFKGGYHYTRATAVPGYKFIKVAFTILE